jgi:3-oxoacyl-[acyl-carrier-protein] synthase-3
MTICSRIVGTGGYLPQRIVTNGDLEQTLNTSNAWIVERTGIRERRIAAEHESTSDLALSAAKRALESAGIAAKDLDLIIVATTTPDQLLPATACIVQAKLGIAGCPAFDIQAACAGFVYALALADQFIRCGQAKYALIVGAETLSRILDWQDRGTAILFGDGAGAAVLAADTIPGVISTHLHADGHFVHDLQVPTGVGRYPGIELDKALISMHGSVIFKMAVKLMESMVDEVLSENGLDKTAIDWLIPHQANIRIIEAAAKKLAMDMTRVVVTVDRHANTSAASIPLALDDGIQSGRIQKNDLLLLEGVGAGLSWGAALVRL